MVASSLVPLTEKLRYLIAFGPACSTRRLPPEWPQRSTAFPAERLLINIVTGGDPSENTGDGIFLDHDSRF